MDSSVVPYKETRQIRKTIKERIHYLDRNTTEKGKPSSFNETQFDHSTGTNAHENLSTNKQKAATVAFYKPILSMLLKFINFIKFINFNKPSFLKSFPYGEECAFGF